MLTEEMTGSSGLLPLTVERSRQCGLEELSDRLVGIRYYVLEYPECGWPTRTEGGRTSHVHTKMAADTALLCM